MKKSLHTLRSRVGRVMRDVGRQLERIDASRQDRAREVLGRASRTLTQQTKDKKKLYAFHAPEVECISKGKARTPYEFDSGLGKETCPRADLGLSIAPAANGADQARARSSLTPRPSLRRNNARRVTPSE